MNKGTKNDSKNSTFSFFLSTSLSNRTQTLYYIYIRRTHIIKSIKKMLYLFIWIYPTFSSHIELSAVIQTPLQFIFKVFHLFLPIFMREKKMSSFFSTRWNTFHTFLCYLSRDLSFASFLFISFMNKKLLFFSLHL